MHQEQTAHAAEATDNLGMIGCGTRSFTFRSDLYDCNGSGALLYNLSRPSPHDMITHLQPGDIHLPAQPQLLKSTEQTDKRYTEWTHTNGTPRNSPILQPPAHLPKCR